MTAIKPVLDVACVILAAGRGSRFGSDKMRHPYSAGQSLIEATVGQYHKVFDEVTVVVRGDDIQTHPLAAKDGVSLLVAAHADAGMSQSLIAGVSANSHCQGWLIALGDMPGLQPATINAVIKALQVNNIVVPVCNGRRGNPVAFGAEFLAELLQLAGDRGGKSILARHPARVHEVVVSDTAIFQDVDRPDQIPSAGRKFTD